MRWTKMILLLLVLFGFIFGLNYTSNKIDIMLGIENPGLIKIGPGATGEITITLIGTNLPLPVQAEKLTGLNSRVSEAVGKSARIARKAKTRGHEAAAALREAVQRTLEEAQNIARDYWAGAQ